MVSPGLIILKLFTTVEGPDFPSASIPLVLISGNRDRPRNSPSKRLQSLLVNERYETLDKRNRTSGRENEMSKTFEVTYNTNYFELAIDLQILTLSYHYNELFRIETH